MVISKRRIVQSTVLLVAVLASTVFPAAAAADEAAPGATVTPHLGLDPTTPVVVTVAATGVPPDTEMNVMECLPGNCFQLANPTSAGDGTLSIPVSVQWTYGPTASECDWDDAGAFCYVRVYYRNPVLGGADILIDSIELTFIGHDSRAQNVAPTCNPMSITTAEDEIATGTIDCSDGDGDPLFGALVSGPAHGNVGFGPNGVYLYTPDSNYNGPDTFTFVAQDGTTSSALVMATVTVTPVADAPVSAGDDYSTAFETALSVSAPGVLTNDSDVDGDALEAALVTATTHGTLVLDADGSLQYSPDDGFSGVDSFIYHAADATSDGNDVSVELTVEPPSPNRAPVCPSVGLTGRPGIAISGTLTCTDADGDALTYTKVTDVRGSTWSLAPDGSFTFVGGKNLVGTVNLTYTTSDGLASTEAVISFTMVGNSAPVCAARTLSGPINSSISGTMACADADPLTYAPVTKTRLGTWVLARSGAFTFTPAANFAGAVTLTYRASDGQATTNGTITFNFENQAPVCPALALSGPRNQPISGVLSCTSADGRPLTYSAVPKVKIKNGALTISPNGAFTFTPSSSFVGTTVVPYRVTDGSTVVSGSMSLTFV